MDETKTLPRAEERRRALAAAAVTLIPCADYSREEAERAVDRAVQASAALRGIKPGMTVVIKANLVAPLKPQRAATTHPALLAALSRYIAGRGARAVIGDSPGGAFTKSYVDGVCAAAGLREAEAAGAELNRDFTVRTARYPEAAAARTFDYTAYLDRADLIVNFCKLKTHGMMSLSCAVKNMFGAVPGLEKPEYHYRFPDPAVFADMLIDLNEYFCPAVNLADAVTAMEGCGPTNGRPRHMGLLLVSESPYALDAVAAGLIGLAPASVPTIAAAAKRGLGPASAGEARVCGSMARFSVPDFDKSAAKNQLAVFMSDRSAVGRFVNRAAGRVLTTRPGLGPVPCVGCGKCASLCPAKAIRMERGRAKIDRSRCIRCFCCQEFCPAGAMIPKRTALARLLIRHRG